MKMTLSVLALALSTAHAHAQTDLFVDATATGGNGSQQSPFATIQAAVDVAASEATIYVADGTYAPFQSAIPVSVIGSDAGITTIRFDSGSFEQCSISGPGLSSTPTIEITNLHFDGLGDSIEEQAIAFSGDINITITDCHFVGLSKERYALEFDRTINCQLDRCNFTDCGGILFCSDLNETFGGFAIRHCQFTGNGSDNGQLFLIFKDGGSSIEDCLFEGNIGGILFADVIPQMLVRNSRFVDNLTPVGLGAFSTGFFGPEIERCLFVGPRDGAALPTSGTPLFSRVPRVFECRVEGHATGHRAPVSEFSSLRESIITGVDAGSESMFQFSDLLNCTVAGNRTAAPSGLLDQGSSTNSILTDHQGQVLANAPDVRYSLVQGGARGPMNLTGSPRFVGPLSGNFELRPDSPCLGAGDPSMPNEAGVNADLGAVQFYAPFMPRSGTFCEGIETSEGCTPTISGSGFATLAPGGTTELSVDRLPAGTFGLFFISPNGLASPMVGGILCTGSPSARADVFQLGGSGPCGGQTTAVLTSAELLGLGFAPGDYLYAQFIARDVPNPNGLGITLTPALEMVVGN